MLLTVTYSHLFTLLYNTFLNNHRQRIIPSAGCYFSALLEELLTGETFNYTYYPPEFPVSSEIEKYQTDLNQLNLKEARVRTAYKNGIDSLEEYKESRFRIHEEKKNLQKLIIGYCYKALHTASCLSFVHES